MSLSEDLAWRGLIKDKTFDDNAFLDEPNTFYHGVDASSDSLTIGNLAVLLLARRLLDADWKTVLLVGGATSLIGDPGGKDAERPLQSRDKITKNVEAIKSQIDKLFGGKPFIHADNYEWFSDMRYLDFLRDVGKHFSMTELMQRDFVSERMGEHGGGISYAEFSYSLIQGYDYWQLYQKQGAVLQIGGSDQWGNMLSGVALIRKKESKEVHAMSMPLVVDKATGRKFGKTEAGAIWLDPAKTTPTQFYQFWINTDDADVEDYLKVFTLLSKEEIESLMTEQKASPAARGAQTALAQQVTNLVHGQSGDSEEVSKYLTGQVSIAEASEENLNRLNRYMLTKPETIQSVLVNSGLASSHTEAKRLLSEGGVYINNKQITRDSFEESDFSNNRLLLRRGKKFRDSVVIEKQYG